jgi:hypothetical protein
MLCSNKQMVLASNWKRFFEKASIVVFLWKWSSMAKTIRQEPNRLKETDLCERALLD